MYHATLLRILVDVNINFCFLISIAFIKETFFKEASFVIGKKNMVRLWKTEKVKEHSIIFLNAHTHRCPRMGMTSTAMHLSNALCERTIDLARVYKYDMLSKFVRST